MQKSFMSISLVVIAISMLAMFIVYVRMEVKDIHLNGPVGPIIHRRADTYVQHPHICFFIECHPYGIYTIRENQFIRIINT